MRPCLRRNILISNIVMSAHDKCLTITDLLPAFSKERFRVESINLTVRL